MPEFENLHLFIIAVVALVLMPGPAVLYVVARSIEQGAKAGIASSFGLMVGAVVHILAAALGLSAILLTSALAFNVIKYLGAIYLIYLGIRKIFFEKDSMDIRSNGPKPMLKVFKQGILVNILNPKAALFFFAFLPQFVNPQQGAVSLQIILLGLLFLVIAFISDVAYSFLAGTLAGWIRGNQKVARTQRILSGSIFIGLGILTALTGRSKG